VDFGINSPLDFLLFVVTVAFYIITTATFNLEKVTKHHREAIRTQEGVKAEKKIFAGEMFGNFLRCLLIVFTFHALAVFPNLAYISSSLLFFFAWRSVYNVEYSTWGKMGKMYPSSQALTVIALAEVACNVDTIVATTVDASLAPLITALLVYFVFFSAIEGLEVGRRLITYTQGFILLIDHPNKRTSEGRKINLLTGRVLHVMANFLLLLVMVCMIPSVRPLIGIKRLLSRNDFGELITGVWTFILIMLGVTVLFQAPYVIKITTSQALFLQQFLSEYVTGVSLEIARGVLKWYVGLFVASCCAFWYAPVIERRSLAKQKSNVVPLRKTA
jgi:hypothetical protein